MGSFEVSIGIFGGSWEMHRGIQGICITIGTIHTSPLPISGMGQFSATYARSTRLREYFDRATRLLTVTSPILFTTAYSTVLQAERSPT